MPATCKSCGKLVGIFDLDFGGGYDTSHTMNVGENVFVDVYVSNVPAAGLISFGFDLTFDPTPTGSWCGVDC